jgi:8-oxo-dGTP diphosphatase
VKERNAMTLEQFVIKVLGIAKIGKKFSQDPYALDNYEELYTLGQEMASNMMPPQDVCTIFERDVYPTPNLSVRVMITDQNNRILFVRERQDGLWSIPGGWVDLFQSVQQAAIAEALQEAGVTVKINRILAMFQREKHKDYPTLISETCIYFHAVVESGEPHPGFETLDTMWISVDEGLPPLSRKNSKEEIMISWECYIKNNQPYFE